ncbi:MAG: putative sensor domain DACNV-containing protein, partial [bacterium]
MHVYPKDLAELLRTLWSKDRHGPFVCTAGDGTPADPLPAVDILEEIISTCYQVSMMQEEGRSIRFR